MTEAQPNLERRPTPLELNAELRALYSVIPQGALEQQLELHPEIDYKQLLSLSDISSPEDFTISQIGLGAQQRLSSRYDSELLEKMSARMGSLLKQAVITPVFREHIVDLYKAEFSTGKGQIKLSNIKERIQVMDETSGGIFDPDLAKQIETRVYHEKLNDQLRDTRLLEAIFGDKEESSPIGRDVSGGDSEGSSEKMFPQISLPEWRQAFLELHHQEP